jgi:hypothetical protein
MQWWLYILVAIGVFLGNFQLQKKLITFLILYPIKGIPKRAVRTKLIEYLR